MSCADYQILDVIKVIGNHSLLWLEYCELVPSPPRFGVRHGQ